MQNLWRWIEVMMFKLVLEKTEEPEIKLPTSAGSSKKQESSRKMSTSALLAMTKPLTVWTITNSGKFLREGKTRPPDLPPEKSVCRSRSTVRTGHGKTDWFQMGKGLCQHCILSPAYLTSVQSTSWEMLGWMKHKLESRFPGEISVPQICRCHHPYGRKQRTKEPLDESERGEWKSWFKTQHSEN